MAKLAPTKSTDDYDPVETIKTLSDNIYRPDKFAEIFCAAAKKQKMIDDCLKEIVRDLLGRDHETKEHVKLIIEEYEKQNVRRMYKKIGFAFWSIFLLFLGSLFTFLGSLFSKWLT
jgi:hypothetical protein